MKNSQFALTTFGLRVREHRQERGLTIGDFADFLTLEPCDVAAIESGLRNADIAYIQKVSQLLGLDFCETSELIRLSRGKRNADERAFYRTRRALHERSAKVLRELHTWKPAVIRRLNQYMGYRWRAT